MASVKTANQGAAHAAPSPGRFRVSLWTPKPYASVTAYLGDQPPTVTGGGGGWESVKLPGRKPVLVWRQPQALVQTIPMLLDGFIDGEPGEVAAAMALLNTFYGVGADTEPPVVRVACASNAVLYKGAYEWGVTGLTWGDASADENAARTQQAVTVELTEHTADQRVGAIVYKGSVPKKRAAKAKKKSGTSKSEPEFYVVKSGDTLSGIANRKNVKGGWRALANAQKPPITDPSTLAVGRKLRIP